MTTPKPCERCGQVDCPTLSALRQEFPVAFISCAVMRWVLAQVGYSR